MKYRNYAKVVIVLLGIVLLARSAWSDEIHLKNGDRITGTVIRESVETITVNSLVVGLIQIDKNNIKQRIVEVPLRNEERPESQQIIEAAKELDEWERKISLGYSQTGGNTVDSNGTAELMLMRKNSRSEVTARVRGNISTSDGKMDGRDFDGLLRYAYSFGKRKQWYHFFKFEGDQDKFINIDYRLVPSMGIGYWFSDTEELKMMAELAAGYELTHFSDQTKQTSEMVLVPRGFLETKLVGKMKFSEDITVYPSLDESNKYRLHSETSLINPINEKVDWKLSFIDDFNSSPTAGNKKNDYSLLTSVDIKF